MYPTSKTWTSIEFPVYFLRASDLVVPSEILLKRVKIAHSDGTRTKDKELYGSYNMKSLLQLHEDYTVSLLSSLDTSAVCFI